MGKAAEYLVAAACILATRGELNVSTSLVDDEGVDLVFNRRDSPATLAVQVKARMSDGKAGETRAGRRPVRVNKIARRGHAQTTHRLAQHDERSRSASPSRGHNVAIPMGDDNDRLHHDSDPHHTRAVAIPHRGDVEQRSTVRAVLAQRPRYGVPQQPAA
jgi:hypothetical protein